MNSEYKYFGLPGAGAAADDDCVRVCLVETWFVGCTWQTTARNFYILNQMRRVKRDDNTRLRPTRTEQRRQQKKTTKQGRKQKESSLFRCKCVQLVTANGET